MVPGSYVESKLKGTYYTDMMTLRNYQEPSKIFKHFGAKKDLGWFLVVTKRHHVGVICAFQLGFDVFDFVLLHEEKIAIEVRRHVASFVVADSIEIAQRPRKRVNAGSDQMPGEVIVSWIAFCQRKQRLQLKN